MKKKTPTHRKLSVLDLAIPVGLVALFVAVTVPLIQGAVMRHRTAECARKILWAAEAFDYYADITGEYPPTDVASDTSRLKLEGVFAAFQMDWWDKDTDLGGHWCWYGSQKTFSIVIAGPEASEKHMKELDAMLDDGNLETGAFLCLASRYHYVIKHAVL